VPYKPTGRRSGRPPKLIKLPKLGKKPRLTDRQWKALGVEANSLELLKEPWPSRASLRNVASEAGVSPEAVRKWRKSPLYRNGLVWLAAQELKAALSSEPKPATGLARSTRQAHALLHVHLKTNWVGPTISPLDGKTYNDADEYFKHVMAHPDAVWLGDMPEQLSIPTKRSK
jgi:hypothetical protein